MNWFRIEKENAIQPIKGSYEDWKEILAEEGRHQCVYCTISERAFGGGRNFHVEHYRPKSIARFKSLTNNIHNLFYACAICNTFKGNDWPNDPTDELSEVCYAEPSRVDYAYLFMLTVTCDITGKNVAARYMVEKLYLNRPQLVLERREDRVLTRLKNMSQSVKEDLEALLYRTDAISYALLTELIRNREKTHALLLEARDLIPYRHEDVSR